MLIGEKVKS